PVWLSLSALAIAWTSVQADVLRGGAPWLYLRSLPHIAPLEIKLDLWLLLIADLPLLLPFAAYELSQLYSSDQDAGINSLLALALALQLPLIQQQILRGALPAALWVFAISLCAVLIQGQGGHREAVAALLVAGPIGGIQLHNSRLGRLCKSKPGSYWRLGKLREHHRPLANLALINLRTLFQYPEITARMPLPVYAGGIVWFELSWQDMGFQTQVANWLLSISVIPLTLQVASLEITLRTARIPMIPLLASLGVSWRHFLIADLLILESLFTLLALAPVAILYLNTGLPRTVIILPLGGIGLTMLTWVYAHSQANKAKILPKLMVSGFILTMSWLWILK
ncbi:MAG: hypothetical protein LUQ11_05080, partial [Methylococcaceae bacterium]|nr:hypothetical protein [Methylococcaceae bacterium]